MASSVAILMPGYPDAVGGVADHTDRLLESWSSIGYSVSVLGNITNHPKSVAHELARGDIGSILIEYVPFLYARHGLSRFPARLVANARSLGIRTTLFVHEPWVPPTRLPWLVLSPLQKRQLLRLARMCDAVVTPVPTWQRALRVPVSIVYSGSNLGRPGDRALDGSKSSCPVVFSPFAAGLSWSWISTATAKLRTTPPLTVLGASANQFREHPVTGQWYSPEWDYRGWLPPEEILGALARARLVLAPFVDGVTGRRTSILAALSVGARIVSSTGHLYDDSFGDGPIDVVETEQQFAEAAQRIWNTPDDSGEQKRRVQWYRENLDYQILDERLLAIVTGKAQAQAP